MLEVEIVAGQLFDPRFIMLGQAVVRGARSVILRRLGAAAFNLLPVKKIVEIQDLSSAQTGDR